MEQRAVRTGRRSVRWLVRGPGALALAALGGVLVAPGLSSGTAAPAAVAAGGGALADGPQDWVRTWQASVQPPVAPGSTLARGVGAVTVRMRLHVSAGGDLARLTLTNRYGLSPLEVRAVSVALPEQLTGGSAVARPGSARPVLFAGAASVVVPPGAAAVSDPVRFAVPAHGDVLVSVAYDGPVRPLSGHQTTTSTAWVSLPGDHTADPGGGAFVRSFSAWPTVTALDVVPAGGPVPVVVALGDSITEGAHSTPDADRRWPDALADMMPRVAVANAGIGGNRVVTTLPRAGDAATDRLERDVLDVPGASVVVVAEGVNDVANGTDATAVVAGLRDVATRARARGLAVVLCTVTPFGARDSWSPADERQREAVNAWIRGPALGEGVADAVADLDAAVRDPARPDRIAAAYDSGDGIHPDDTGYAVIAATVVPAVRAVLPPA